MNKKQTYTAPIVDNVVIFTQDAVLGFSSPTSNESLAIMSILGGTEEDGGIEW